MMKVKIKISFKIQLDLIKIKIKKNNLHLKMKIKKTPLIKINKIMIFRKPGPDLKLNLNFSAINFNLLISIKKKISIKSISKKVFLILKKKMKAALLTPEEEL
jgi:hypothetical protein